MRASSALAASGGHRRASAAERADDAVEQRHRHLAEARRPAEQREQQLALLRAA